MDLPRHAVPSTGERYTCVDLVSDVDRAIDCHNSHVLQWVNPFSEGSAFSRLLSIFVLFATQDSVICID